MEPTDHVKDLRNVKLSIERFSLYINTVLGEIVTKDSSESLFGTLELVVVLVEESSQYVKKVIPRTTKCLANLSIFCHRLLSQSFDSFRGGNATCFVADIKSIGKKLVALGKLNRDFSKRTLMRTIKFKRIPKALRAELDATIDALCLSKLLFSLNPSEKLLNPYIILAYERFTAALLTISAVCSRLNTLITQLQNIKGKQHSDYQISMQIVLEVNYACKSFQRATCLIEKQLQLGIVELDN